MCFFKERENVFFCINVELQSDYIFYVYYFAVLKNAFDAFDQEKKGSIDTTMVGTILSMLGHQLDDKMLAEIIR